MYNNQSNDLNGVI